MRWHPKAAPLVKFAYQIFHGSINTNNPAYNPKLQEVLQLTERCLVCQLSNQEWAHLLGIIVAGNQGGCCSAKVANTLVPQMDPNVVNLAETFRVETGSIKVLQKFPGAKLPSKAMEGSATYDLFPQAQGTAMISLLFPLVFSYFSILLCSTTSMTLHSTTDPQSTDFSVFH